MENESIQQDLHRYYDRMTSGVCLVGMDPDETILFVNPGMLRIYHCTDEDDFYRFTGRRFQGMVDGNNYRPISDLSQPDESQFVTFRFRTRDDHFRRAEGSASTLVLENGQKVWLLQLISGELKSSSIQRDPLTGLLGMRTFYEKALQMARVESSKGCLDNYSPVYLNITHFRLYNAIHGLAAGDRLLQQTAALLQQTFPQALMTHLGADSFDVLAPRADLFQKLEVLSSRVNALINHPNIALKAGICLLQKDDIHIMRHTFDMAKIACDSIKKDGMHSWSVYTRNMGEALEKRDFVLENFDEALEKGYIKVYYQPVVRALTGKLCGLEALARWEDPMYGRLAPNVFVPVLEQARLIHKLDRYVIEEVTKRLHYQFVHKRPVLPVSFNLSRYDFNLMDPFTMVEALMKRYDLPRDYIRIEVTETALVKEKHNLVQTLRQFQDSGYQVWLDDFGSAYSSLNVLHNYRFDELKIDMAFLRNFNEESRKIIKSIVLMAKTLGVHTLAEGAETKEQVEFLKSVGCEKIQGYYFGQPMAYEECRVFCRHYDGGLESRLEEHAFDRAGTVNVVTGMPVAILSYDDARVRMLLRNKAYRNVLKDCNSPNFSGHADGDYLPETVQQRVRPLMDKAVARKKKQAMTYVENGHYLRLQVEIQGGTDGFYVGCASIARLDYGQREHTFQRRDRLLRNVLQLYSGIYHFRGDQDTVEAIRTLSSYMAEGQVLAGIAKALAVYANRFVYDEDRERFLKFMDFDRLFQIARHQKEWNTGNAFRIRQEDGSYRWIVFWGIIPYGTTAKDLILVVRDAVWELPESRSRLLPAMAEALSLSREERKPYPQFMQELGLAMIRYSELKFFWKDRQRRFVGVSRAFLKYYGIRSEKVLLGKTDEDMGWHIDYRPYKEAEEAVLKKGEVIRNIPGECLIGGRPHHIVATKFPVYRGKKIIGLLGYFYDAESVASQQKELEKINVIDTETGFLNLRGLLLAAADYVNNYQSYGDDYTCILFEVPEYSRIRRDYGKVIARKLLQEIKKRIRSFRPLKTTIAYLGNCRFVYLRNSTSDDGMRRHIMALANEIHGITAIDGCSCTLYLQYALARGSEAEHFDAVLKLLEERLADARRQQYGEALYVGDRVVFEREAFDSLDEEVSIIDLDTYALVYANEKMRRDYHLDDSSWAGKPCYEVLSNSTAPCADCINPQLRRGRFQLCMRRSHNTGLNLLMQAALIPWRGKDYRFTMALDIGPYINHDAAENYVLFREIMANDVIAIGMREANPETGLQKMLERIGQSLQAERVLVLEEQENMVSATYEWHQDGLETMMPRTQHVPLKTLRPLYAAFDSNQLAIIEDATAFAKTHPGFRPIIPGVRRIVLGHMVQSGRSLGFVEVINPSALAFKSAGLLLSTLTIFLAIMLRNRDAFRTLERMSTTDQLTAIGNRRGFEEYLKTLPEDTLTAFIFGDLNGLKTVNDAQGHEAGDRLLCKAVEVMTGVVGSDTVFRMGGDEFLAIVPDTDEKKARQLLNELRARFQHGGISMALGCLVRQTPIANIDEVLSEVDRKMYLDKNRIYGGEHKESR